MFWHFYKAPRPGEVYNAGGGRFANCSMIEAIAQCEAITGNKMDIHYSDQARSGEHIWYISDTGKFKEHYPGWTQQHNLTDTLTGIFEGLKKRLN